ncbi:hypothetical protein [Prosthecobacter sp.]|uniref:hypothetical protein n=1 Tax=Prosthecobacter sp. TaxID=1965333 RepID=UPI002489C181|nr:hypothetical protein [Prosthecobacter sp.]MDI1312698.1 hypothetical protein [Prosthecobacter sp.]
MKTHSFFIASLAAVSFMALTSCDTMDDDDDDRRPPPTTMTTTTEETTLTRTPLSPVPVSTTTETSTIRSY